MFVVFGLMVFGIGAIGLAIDGSHLYAERQMAQAAADAAAQAGIRSIFTGTYSNGSSQDFSANLPGPYTCTSSDSKTPCYYAQTMNGFDSGGDTVSFQVPSASSVGLIPCGSASTTLYCGGGTNLLQVTVSRKVQTSFFKLIASWTPSVTASATGAIVSVMSPVPIIVTHPYISNAFSTNGTGTKAKIQICGGPSLSIQVNSSSGSSLHSSGQGAIDLSHAGPLDPGNCSTGTGASFGDYGGPNPSGLTLQLGSTGSYNQPTYPIYDPLSGVNPPSIPSAAPKATALANGVSGCPASPQKSCTLYYPGLYTSDINVTNQTAVFSPGIYYMSSTGSNQGANFLTGANGYMTMATGLTDGATGTNTGWTSNILVYMTGPSVTSIGNGGNACMPASPAANIGQISVGANGSVSLTGSPASSSYKGILFFVDRRAETQSHTLDGGGGLTLVGTIYMTDTLNQMSSTTCSQYQKLTMQGNSGSSTHIQGEIIASTLTLGGTPGIVMDLNPNAVSPVRQIALVQ